MISAKFIKGSLAAAALNLVLFFPTAAAPLSFIEKVDAGEGLSPASVVSWRQYDINGDGQFDVTDINELIDSGAQNIEFDLNADGKKDFDDALMLFLQLSVMDRSCNRVVDDEDYEPIDPVSLPEVPDIQDVRRLVVESVSGARVKLPSDIEDQAFRSVPPGKILTIAERAYVYQLAGISGLAQMNLDAATWGFGRAFQTNERSAGAIGSLAFCMAVEDNDDKALIMLAYAREIYRESAPAATSLGWIFARHGQNDEALKYFREAVFYAPGIAQYHMNLGVMLMRMGLKRDAYDQFKAATELDPGDAKKMLFWYTTKPPDEPPVKEPFDPEEFKNEQEIEINMMKEMGYSEDELPEPWDQMSPCEQARRIPEILERRSAEQMKEIAQAYANETAKKIESIIKGYWPQWRNITEDWDRYVEGVPVVNKASQTLTLNSEIAAGHRRATLTRQMGRELMGYSSFFMESALKQADAEAKNALNRLPKGIPITGQAAAELRAKAYRDALEEAIKYCYKSQINQAYSWLMAESTPYGLPKPEVEAISPSEFMTLFMVIPARCFDIKGYCPDGIGGDFEKPSTENTIGINLLIVSFECNATGEWEFNVGQGIIVGVTWKPETGFGFQTGAGIDFMGMEEAIYVRIDEGKITIERDEGVSLGFGPLYAGTEAHNIMATFELP